MSKASDCWALLIKWFEWEYETIQCAALTGGANLSHHWEYKKYGAAGGLERCVGILAAKAAKVASICMNKGLSANSNHRSDRRQKDEEEGGV